MTVIAEKLIAPVISEHIINLVQQLAASGQQSDPKGRKYVLTSLTLNAPGSSSIYGDLTYMVCPFASS